MAKRGYTGYSLYNVYGVTKDKKKWCLIWECEESHLVPFSEFESGIEDILMGATEDNIFYSWLDFNRRDN